MSEDELRERLQNTDAFRGLMEAVKRLGEAARESLETFAEIVREHIMPIAEAAFDLIRELLDAVDEASEKTIPPRGLVRCIGSRPETRRKATACCYHRSGCRHK